MSNFFMASPRLTLIVRSLKKPLNTTVGAIRKETNPFPALARIVRLRFSPVLDEGDGPPYENLGVSHDESISAL
jgi:hypothetical protein